VRSILADNRVNVSDDVEEYFDSLDKGLVLNVRISPRDQGEAYGCADGCQVFEDDSALIQLSLGAVPDVVGKPLDEAVRTLEGVQLKVADDRPEDWSESVARGSVIAQSKERPEGGAWRPGDTVTLTVSKGPQPLPIPDVKGKTVRDAVATLKDAGFKVNPSIEDMDLPLGGKYWDVYKVCSYDPSGTAARGATVTLTPGFFC
jgi:serine/threonine-protein kinase